MTFYFDRSANELVGNFIGRFTTVDGDEVTIDVDGIMEDGRGLGKLREMQGAIEDAIDANEDA